MTVDQNMFTVYMYVIRVPGGAGGGGDLGRRRRPQMVDYLMQEKFYSGPL